MMDGIYVVYDVVIRFGGLFNIKETFWFPRDTDVNDAIDTLEDITGGRVMKLIFIGSYDC